MVATQLSEHEANWYAIYTRYKAEKEVVRLLQRRRIESYVPLNRIVKQYKSKRKVLELPLINSYVFVKIVRQQYIPVLETNNVLKFIHFNGKLVPIPESEIDLLRRICQEKMDVEAGAFVFEKGHQVEIIGGNLTGVRGKLVDQRGNNFVFELEHIGWGIYMEIVAARLRVLGPAVVPPREEDDEGIFSRKYL